MITVKVGQQDQPDPGRVHPVPLHADEGGGSAIEEKADFPSLNADAGLKPSPAPESVPGSEKKHFHFFHQQKSPENFWAFEKPAEMNCKL
jgi:hypothetical protein